MSEQAQWTAMAGGGSAPSMTAEMAPPPMAQPPMAQPAAPAASSNGKKQKREKAPKAPKAAKTRMSATTGGSGGDIGLLSFAPGPSREQMEREAADELMAALTPSYQLLRNEVPDAASPDDAQRKIEGQLDRLVPDNDHELPNHPIYQGDALVYYQLRRHYGSPHPGGTFRRSWFPMLGGG